MNCYHYRTLDSGWLGSDGWDVNPVPIWTHCGTQDLWDLYGFTGPANEYSETPPEKNNGPFGLQKNMIEIENLYDYANRDSGKFHNAYNPNNRDVPIGTIVKFDYDGDSGDNTLAARDYLEYQLHLLGELSCGIAHQYEIPDRYGDVPNSSTAFDYYDVPKYILPLWENQWEPEGWDGYDLIFINTVLNHPDFNPNWDSFSGWHGNDGWSGNDTIFEHTSGCGLGRFYETPYDSDPGPIPQGSWSFYQFAVPVNGATPVMWGGLNQVDRILKGWIGNPSDGMDSTIKCCVLEDHEFGCTDPTASNYNPDAVPDNPSDNCEYEWECDNHLDCPQYYYCHSGWDGEQYGERFCVYAGFAGDASPEGQNFIDYCDNFFCGSGDGDCDTDGQCAGNLRCGSDGGGVGANCSFDGINDIIRSGATCCELDSDLDGIPDTEDDCVGVVDECGVCGGTGPNYYCDQGPVGVGNYCSDNNEPVCVPSDCPLTYDCNLDCGGSAEYDVCGICDGDNSTCTGCTDPEALNYDPNAIIDSEMCNYGEPGEGEQLSGCTDPSACNYSPQAVNDDGSCYYETTITCWIDGMSQSIPVTDCDPVCPQGTDSTDDEGCLLEWACNYEPNSNGCAGGGFDCCIGTINQHTFTAPGVGQIYLSNSNSLGLPAGGYNATVMGPTSSETGVILTESTFTYDIAESCMFLQNFIEPTNNNYPIMNIGGGGIHQCYSSYFNDGTIDPFIQLIYDGGNNLVGYQEILFGVPINEGGPCSIFNGDPILGGISNNWVYWDHNADVSVFDALGQATFGCTDVEACNYVPNVLYETECTYALPYRDCDGNCYNDTDGDGLCNEEDTYPDCDGLVDECGECNGNNQSMDCNGVCDGTAVVDDCGVCGGDGTSCNYFSWYGVTPGVISDLNAGINNISLDYVISDDLQLSAVTLEINDLNDVGVVFVGDNLCAGLNCMISENQFMGGHDFNIYIPDIVSFIGALPFTIDIRFNVIGSDENPTWNMCSNTPESGEDPCDYRITKTMWIVDGEFIAGDINGDEMVNVNDIVMAVNHILDIEPFNNPITGEIQHMYADTNQDGVVNIADVILMVNSIMGISAQQQSAIMNEVNQSLEIPPPRPPLTPISDNRPITSILGEVSKSVRTQPRRRKARPNRNVRGRMNPIRPGDSVRDIEPQLYYVKYRTKPNPQQEKQKHNARMVERATKRDDLIPSARNVVVVEADNIESFRQDPNVEYVEEVPVDIPDLPFHQETTNDPLYYSGANGSQSTIRMQLNHESALQEFGFGEYEPIVGVHDSGMLGHPDVSRYQLSPNSTGQGASMYYGHGLACASIIGADTNNEIGMTGMCPNCSTWLMTPYTSQGGGLIANLETAVEYGVKVINNSNGGGNFNQTYQNAITDAYNAGTLMVVTAGNEGMDLNGTFRQYCSYDNVLCVGSNSGYNYDSSCSGAEPGPCDSIDVSSYMSMGASPGSGVGAASCMGLNGEDVDPWSDECWFRTLTGTSYAAPVVAGLLGLLLSHNPDLTPTQMYEIVTSTNIHSASGQRPGVIDFYEALSYMYENYVEPGDSQLQEFTYELRGGNNFISFPFQMDNNSVEDFMLEHNAINVLGPGQGLFNDNGNISGNYTNFVPEDGFTVHLPGGNMDTIVINVTGTPLPPLTYDLISMGAGSNYKISYDGVDDMDTIQALGEWENQIEYILGDGMGLFNEGVGTGISDWSGNLTTLRFGEGYWIQTLGGIAEFQWNRTMMATSTTPIIESDMEVERKIKRLRLGVEDEMRRVDIGTQQPPIKPGDSVRDINPN